MVQREVASMFPIPLAPRSPKPLTGERFLQMSVDSNTTWEDRALIPGLNSEAEDSVTPTETRKPQPP